MKKIKSGLEVKLEEEKKSVFEKVRNKDSDTTEVDKNSKRPNKKNKKDRNVANKTKENKLEDEKVPKKRRQSKTKVKKKDNEDNQSIVNEEIKVKRFKNKSGERKKDKQDKSERKEDNQSKSERKKDKQSKREQTLPSSDKMKTPMTRLEKSLLTRGTTRDKISVLSLQIERNPSAENYKNLLFYAENQRNEVIYKVLKDIKNLLISKGVCENSYIKQKIVKSFEINLKNIFIKQKVIKLVFELLKKNIYFLELIFPFLNKLGDKKEIEDFVFEKTKQLFPLQEEIILENLEDFYFKSPSFKARNSLLKLLGELSPTNREEQLNLYIKFLEAFDLNLPEEHKTILLRHLCEGLSSILEIFNKEFDLPQQVLDTLKLSVSPELSLPIFKIFYFSKSPNTKEILYRILSFSPSQDLMALIFKYLLEIKDKKILKYLLSRSLLYKKEFILAILYLLRREKEIDLFPLSILSNHYSIVVRKTVKKIINKEEFREIQPFDEIDFEVHENL